MKAQDQDHIYDTKIMLSAVLSMNEQSHYKYEKTKIRPKKDRFPTKRQSKLRSRSDGPFRVLAQVNNNAYKVSLPRTPKEAASFNVADIEPYYDPVDPIPCLRANFLRLRRMIGRNWEEINKRVDFYSTPSVPF
ncbi:hypothetical protein Tco_0314068 [Tanacetum coccineum]